MTKTQKRVLLIAAISMACFLHIFSLIFWTYRMVTDGGSKNPLRNRRCNSPSAGLIQTASTLLAQRFQLEHGKVRVQAIDAIGRFVTGIRKLQRITLEKLAATSRSNHRTMSSSQNTAVHGI